MTIRKQTPLDGRWDFYPDPTRSLRHDSLDAASARQILVPGPWQAQFDDLRHYVGVAWYRRQFLVELTSPLPPDPVFILHFGAVDYHAMVWVNGTFVGEHEGGYLPFELEIGDGVLANGSNEIVVRALDPGDDMEETPEYAFAEIPHGKQSWYGPIGGIWQSAWLEIRHRVHLTRLRLTPDVPGAQVRVEVSLTHAPAPGSVVQLTLLDPNGERQVHTFETDGATMDVSLPVPDPMLWDTDTPNLYAVEASLAAARDASVALDRTSATFGMRSIATSQTGHLLLNGRILYLRGALDQDYYPELIYTPFSDAELDAQFAKARHMGLNCLRTHIKITDPRYYDAADRAGLLIWTELPNWQDLTEAAKERAEKTLFGMVERDWNHPSIIIWTIANENWGLDLAVNAGHRAWLADVYTRLKQLDPHRLAVGNSPCFTNFHVVTDIEDFHNYYAIPDHYKAWKDWVQTFASRPPWTFAHVYESINAWREYVRDPWNPAPRTPAAEIRRRGSEPMVVSEFGNWGLPDVAQLRSCYGGAEPWWFETGIEWGDGVVYPHGIEQRYRAYHLDKTFPTLSDLSAASQRMQFTALKYQIEQMRRHPSIVGYIITEFTDVHWESNGLLDMCRNPKAYFDVIRDINGADAIIPVDWERVAFWQGERCEVRLALSHFSPHDLRECRIEWELDAFPEIRGAFAGFAAQRAQLTSIGTAVFEVPAVDRSLRVRLQMRLIDASGGIVARNHHEMYFFPRIETRQRPRVAVPGLPRLGARLSAMGYEIADTLDAADLVVVEHMTDEMRWFAQNGGRVLWLAETSESHQSHLGNLGIAQRHGRSWQGDWASSMSWLRQDRIFRDIPTGGTVDFAFADLTPEAVIVGLSPRDFSTNVHAGLFVGWVHHVVALVAERAVDRGRLLACTFRLREHLGSHPVATIMMRDMIERVARPLAEAERAPHAPSGPPVAALG